MSTKMLRKLCTRQRHGNFARTYCNVTQEFRRRDFWHTNLLEMLVERQRNNFVNAWTCTVLLLVQYKYNYTFVLRLIWPRKYKNRFLVNHLTEYITEHTAPKNQRRGYRLQKTWIANKESMTEPPNGKPKFQER